MKYDVRQLPLLSNTEIAQGIFDMRLAYAQEDLPVACGQFAHVYVPGKTLRRPISVCDASGGELRLVYQVKGEGTKIMSQMQSGTVDVLAPLGNGFHIEPGKRYALIGGGIGVPPMLYTAKQCDDPLIITGFRNASLVILQEDLAAQGETLLCTDDGTAGVKGFVTDLLRAHIADVPAAPRRCSRRWRRFAKNTASPVRYRWRSAWAAASALVWCAPSRCAKTGKRSCSTSAKTVPYSTRRR